MKQNLWITGNQPNAKRLVALIPNYQQIGNELVWGRFFYNLASKHQCSIVLLTVIHSYDDDLPALHKFTRLVSIAKNGRFGASYHLAFQIPWLKAVKQVYQEGDLILAFADHMVRNHILVNQPLYQVLTSKFSMPVELIDKVQ
ncbi:MAG: hypothetical protein JXB15_10695 [Anaerolineales bacterium]|nr:hypothetical protein [Anaerolineales bacterium]